MADKTNRSSALSTSLPTMHAASPRRMPTLHAETGRCGAKTRVCASMREKAAGDSVTVMCSEARKAVSVVLKIGSWA